VQKARVDSAIVDPTEGTYVLDDLRPELEAARRKVLVGRTAREIVVDIVWYEREL